MNTMMFITRLFEAQDGSASVTLACFATQCGFRPQASLSRSATQSKGSQHRDPNGSNHGVDATDVIFDRIAVQQASVD